MRGLFVPGWAAVPGLYVRGLPAGWEALELPTFARTRGDLAVYRSWLDAELARRGEPITLAGHSMGASLAVLAALDRPAAIDRLILLSPTGLPLGKGMIASFATFVGQIARGWYPTIALARAVARVLRAPWSALTLAREVHKLDLTPECERLRAAGIPSTVVACSTDALTPPAQCRHIASLLGAAYREVDARGGHIWMIADPALLAPALATTAG